MNGDIAADSNGNLHAFWVESNGNRYYTRNDGSSWSTPVFVGSGGLSLTGVGLALGPDNSLHAVWEGAGAGSLFYSEYDGVCWTAPNHLGSSNGTNIK